MIISRKQLIGVVTGALALGGAATALASSNAGGPSRMDDGKDLLPQAKITEAQAITAAQTRASGSLNEIDLEHAAGKLVFNIDVGDHDVKVDAGDGHVVAVDQDD